VIDYLQNQPTVRHIETNFSLDIKRILAIKIILRVIKKIIDIKTIVHAIISHRIPSLHYNTNSGTRRINKD